MRISDWSSDVCSSDVSARPRAEEDHRAANIFGRAQTASGNARNHLLLQPRNSLKEAVGHVAWDEARRNGIDVDPLRREVGSKHTGPLVNARLCLAIRAGPIVTTPPTNTNRTH